MQRNLIWGLCNLRVRILRDVQPFLAHLATVDRRFIRQAREYGSRMCDKVKDQERIWMEEYYREHKARRFQER